MGLRPLNQKRGVGYMQLIIGKVYESRSKIDSKNYLVFKVIEQKIDTGYVVETLDHPTIARYYGCRETMYPETGYLSTTYRNITLYKESNLSEEDQSILNSLYIDMALATSDKNWFSSLVSQVNA